MHPGITIDPSVYFHMLLCELDANQALADALGQKISYIYWLNLSI